MIFQNVALEPEVFQHPSGDLVIALCLDPAVAAQVRLLAERWGLDSLSDAVSDLVLTGLISVNSTAARPQ